MYSILLHIQEWLKKCNPRPLNNACCLGANLKLLKSDNLFFMKF